MYKHFSKLRVRYSETDKMGYVYYGNYAQYFEVARVEALRELGLSYKELEENGLMLPVLSYSINYLKPAFYDSLLTIECSLIEMPKTRLKFEFKTMDEKGGVLNNASVVLVFVDMKKNKPILAPDYFIEKLQPFF